MLWLDTYWTTEAPIPTDLWVFAAGQPLRADAAGGRGDHEPCDWMWPISRWTPDVIYHDHYGLRPPSSPVTSVLEIRVGLRDEGEPVGTDRTVGHIPVAITRK